MDFLENICLKTNDHIKDSTKYNYYFGIKYSNGVLELKHDSEPIKSDVDIKEYDVYVCKTDEINVLTYNVYFKNMLKSNNRKNVANFIDNIDLNLHFIAFQEPACSQKIIDESIKLQKMGKIHWVPGSFTLDARYNTDGLVTGVNTTEMLLFYDKERFELKHYVLGYLYDYDRKSSTLRHSRGRPYILGIFEFKNKIENSSPLCFINIHQGHGSAANIIMSINQI